MVAFRGYVSELTKDLGLSTKMASEISVQLALGMLEPVAGQIDPIKLAEMQRATEIAIAYGNRLNEKSNNLRPGGIEALVTGYPSHGFVIDRKEAKRIFIRVERPEGLLSELSQALHSEMMKDVGTKTPKVKILSFASQPVPNAGDGNANSNTSSARSSPEGNAGSELALDGASEESSGGNSDHTDAEPSKPRQPTKRARSARKPQSAAGTQVASVTKIRA
jgi:hypothetical protein